MTTPDRLLTWYAAEAARAGYTCPQLDSPQALRVAEIALAKLGAAAGIVRPQAEPQRALPQHADRPAWDDTTRLLATIAQDHGGAR